MATFPSEFIGLAAELIGDEFAAFATDAIFEQSTGYNPDADEETFQTQTVPCIRMDYESQQISGLIAVSDFMLIGQYQLFTWEPSEDNTFVTYGGKKCQVKNHRIDPAGATITLQVRPL